MKRNQIWMCKQYGRICVLSAVDAPAGTIYLESDQCFIRLTVRSGCSLSKVFKAHYALIGELQD